jgi:hypothetical protein
MPDIFTSTLHTKSNKTTQNVPRQVNKADISSHVVPQIRPNKIQNEGETINIPEGYDIHKHPDHTHSPLASYCFYPDKVEYVNLDAQEKTILLLRKHPIVNLPWIILSFLMVIFPPFLTVFPFFDGMPSSYKLIIFMSWYLVVMAFVIEKFLSWFFNVDLITDERIMDIHFLSLMYREITEANLDEIQEVTVKPATGIYSFFHFGTIYIQTAAERPRLEFIHVPKVEKVAKILRELRVQEEIEKIEGRIR